MKDHGITNILVTVVCFGEGEASELTDMIYI
jgi:hypothetical protein